MPSVQTAARRRPGTTRPTCASSSAADSAGSRRSLKTTSTTSRRKESITDAAGDFGVSRRTVRDAEIRARELKYRSVSLAGVKGIGIDEIDVFHNESVGRQIYAEAKNALEAESLPRAWIDRARASDVSELETMARTMEQNLEGVLGFRRFRGASNAKTEGFNNKIRWLVRQACGHRDYKDFRLKVFDLANIKLRDSDS